MKSEKVIIKDISRERSADKSGQTHTSLVLFFLPINEPTFKFKCVHPGIAVTAVLNIRRRRRRREEVSLILISD